MELILHLLILIGIYTMLSQSLSLSAGFGGLVSLAHAGFYGIGAYSVAILSVEYQVPFWGVFLVALIVSGLLALLVSSIALRTVQDYFIICTLGIQVVVFSIMNNWMSVTNGPLGIPGIPILSIFGFSINSKFEFLLLTSFFVVLIFIFLNYITCTAFGRSLRSLSEDEIFTASLGKNVYLTKLTAFTISGMLAVVPGILYAYYMLYVDPTSFTVDESIFILSIVIIGGMKNFWGCVWASAFLILFPVGLQLAGFPNSIAANLREIIYGAMLIYVVFRYYRSYKFSKK